MARVNAVNRPRRLRRSLSLGAGLLAVTMVLAGCSGNAGGEGENVQLDFVWWGDATRAAQTDAAMRIFEEKNPGITVVTEYQDSAPYRDKLATRFAGGNPPDVMAIPNRNLLEYSQRGALADLSEYSEQFSTEAISEAGLSGGMVDGKLYAVPAGLTAIGLLVNNTMTEAAGVEVPDDLTWSWEDFGAFATEVSKNSPDNIYGTGYSPATETYPILFARQRGEDFYTEDNKLGVSVETMTDWFQFANDLRDDGGFPRVGFFENQGASAAQSYLALNTIASQFAAVNNFAAYDEASGGNLSLLRMPGEVDGERRGHSVDPSQLWAMAAKSEHPEEAARLIDFLINDVDGNTEMLTSRGVPVNPEVASAISDSLSEDDQVFVEYIAKLQEEDLPPVYVYPSGASVVADILQQLATEVEFGRTTPAEAAEKFVKDATAEIDG